MRTGYDIYLSSKKWQRFKESYLLSSASKNCYVCSKPYQKGFHFHHLTYDRFGEEKIEDVVICCDHCHAKIHKSFKAQRGRRKLNIREMSEKVRESYGPAKDFPRMVEKPNRPTISQERQAELNRLSAIGSLVNAHKKTRRRHETTTQRMDREMLEKFRYQDQRRN